jgi:hypothetical protein
MPRAPNAMARPSRRGFPKAYPRVPTIVFAGVVAALLIALIVAGAFLSTELLDTGALEAAEERETWVLSGLVVTLVIGLGILLTFILRRSLVEGSSRKDPPVAA